MKQKYLLEKQEDASLVIKEYGELEEGIFSLLCEEKFEGEELSAVFEKTDKELIGFLRTDNMFPPFSYMEKIAESVRKLFDEAEENSAELVFDEMAMFDIEDEEADEVVPDSEEELLDDILDDSDDDFDGIDDDLNDIDPVDTQSIKVDEDTDLDIED
ncbi:MAG: hypothetical protein CSA18_03790 [Deltaproteobacteria bacterium]|nr:MAG: hypothetical protein CSA18_03790 [Deltaproteobacteria bacterium]